MDWLGNHWDDFVAALKYFAQFLFPRADEVKNNLVINPMEPEAPIQPPVVIAQPKYLWDTFENRRHSVRLICDEEGLTVVQKNNLSATVHCESNFMPNCVHQNKVNGKVTSTDYGIAQINDYWHIGQGKDFPSVDYVLNNPEACIRFMARQFKADNPRLWICYSKGLYTHYAS